MLAWSLDHSAHLQAQVEVRPRGKGEGARQRGELQRVFHRQTNGPVERFEDPGVLVHELAGRVEALASDRVIPEIVMPLRARFDLTGLRASGHCTSCLILMLSLKR